MLSLEPAGLPYLDEDIDIQDVADFMRIQKKIEKSKPVWKPGTASGYHPLTFGFIVDGIVRRVDEKKRDLKTFFMEEIARPNDLEVDIGVEPEESWKVARITTPNLWEFVRDSIKNPKLLIMLGIMYVRFDEILWKIKANSKWLLMNYDTISVNNPELLALPMPAVTGVSSAADLSRLFSLAIDGTLLSNQTLNTISSPTLNSWHLEKVTLWPIRKGHGFFYDRNPLVEDAFTFGHPGYGGQFVHVDPANQMVLSYLANGLKTGTGELCTTYTRLLRSTYNALRAR
ncbi:beta-lactamase [Dictyocaulus viviparus]|uniref:Beta-lactamase n=1 Tax=Dictyocaulus viviparus TaxID=29172 RepID=A0A0D8YDX0_DICVI|nr:beta-lactamase [Dictyocaulus viviparus]